MGWELPALLPRAGTGQDPCVSWRICTGVKLVQCNDAAKPASLASLHQVGADWSHMEMLRLQHFNGKNHCGTHLPENGTNLLTGIFVICLFVCFFFHRPGRRGWEGKQGDQKPDPSSFVSKHPLGNHCFAIALHKSGKSKCFRLC